MSIFHFHHQQNIVSEGTTPTIYFLNEHRQIVPEAKSKNFVVKKRLSNQRGFREFFGVVRNPLYTFDDSVPVPELPFLEEEAGGAYQTYGLDKDVIITIEDKKIPLYILPDFLSMSPNKFGGVSRTKDQVAQHGEKRRSVIAGYYQTLEPSYVQSLTEVNCSSVAYLYNYLNDGKVWKEGMEFYGYVDGLWETGSYLTVSIDTTSWNLHTAVHELGHSVSYFLVQEMFDEWYQIAIDTNEPPPTEYGMTEVSEDFAESFGYYFGGAYDQAQLKKKCPRRAAFMQKLESVKRAGLLRSLEANNELTKRFCKYDKVVYNL